MKLTVGWVMCVAGGQTVVSPQNPKASEGSRDSIAKHVFNCLFDYIVVRVNKVIRLFPL